MKSRIFVSMLVIALAAALVGGATMSIFTAQGETDEKTYAAGTVALSVSGQGILESSTTMDIGNMAPGDTIDGEFEVTNIGSLPLWFKVGYEATGFLFTGGGVEALGEDNGNEGKHNATVTILGDYPQKLEPRASATVGFKVHLPLEAGDEYQEAQGQLKFLVNAEQSAHNENPFGGQEPEEPEEPDNEVEEFEVSSFGIVWEWGEDADTVSFRIVNAKNADGELISAEGKTVQVQLDTSLYGQQWPYGWVDYTRSGSTTVNLVNGEADATVELDGEIGYNGQTQRWIMNNIVVTIDGVVGDMI
jgi:hypothetical protein